MKIILKVHLPPSEVMLLKPMSKQHSTNIDIIDRNDGNPHKLQ